MMGEHIAPMFDNFLIIGDDNILYIQLYHFLKPYDNNIGTLMSLKIKKSWFKVCIIGELVPVHIPSGHENTHFFIGTVFPLSLFENLVHYVVKFIYDFRVFS